jgi:UDP:flavonoid glycosyltransferase YjiC (YdhE family)
MQPGHPDTSGHHGRRRWENPLTDGWDYRWNVLVALPDRSSEAVDAVLASIGSAEANTVVQLASRSRTPTTPPSKNLVHVVGEPLPDLLCGIDVAVVSGEVVEALVVAQRRVPMVVLPATGAQEDVGRALAAAGAGVLVRTAAEVGAAVRTIASDGSRGPRMRGLARRLATVGVLLALLGTSALRPVS